ncbi:MAG: hypothetical protein IT473_04845 [Lysobacter sp.]|nr:hypothetical protein [Lysobacter sp.]
MIIPQHWAEARLQHRERGRQITIRRFGWSDDSLAAAQAHAETRVREAMARALAGEKLLRRERRAAYNGSEGVPIREEIVERDGETVITRNGYGALCLNTPNVLFADIDFDEKAGCRAVLVAMLLLGFAVGIAMRQAFDLSLARAVLIGVVVAILLGDGGVRVWRRAFSALQGGQEGRARKRIARFVAQHPQWRVRLYRTPAGMRLLALHRTFDPRESDVVHAFSALGVDSTYARMCHNQNCFRARLTPKPWRLGMPRLRAPYSAVWQSQHADLPARREWIETYGRASEGYAACRYIETLGVGAVDASADRVRELHDLMCSAERELPLA